MRSVTEPGKETEWEWGGAVVEKAGRRKRNHKNQR